MSFENCFKGKFILVTGAGRGIGRALTLKLDCLGATVWAISKSPDNLSSLKSEGKQIQTLAVDLGDWQATRKAIESIPIVFDCLVNNAGVCPPAKFMDVGPQDIDLICNVNLKAVINVSQVVARRMIEAKKSGSIVNISSVTSLKASPPIAAYSMLRAGLDQLTKIMAIELGPHKIRVNCLNPSGVPTDMFQELISVWSAELGPDYVKRIPLGRPVLEMEEMVNSILFYLSDLVPMMTGTIVPIEGGLSIT